MTLRLSRETLTQLTAGELAGVNAAADALTVGCPTFPLRWCLTMERTCWTES